MTSVLNGRSFNVFREFQSVTLNTLLLSNIKAEKKIYWTEGVD